MWSIAVVDKDFKEQFRFSDIYSGKRAVRLLEIMSSCDYRLKDLKQEGRDNVMVLVDERN